MASRPSERLELGFRAFRPAIEKRGSDVEWVYLKKPFRKLRKDPILFVIRLVPLLVNLIWIPAQLVCNELRRRAVLEEDGAGTLTLGADALMLTAQGSWAGDQTVSTWELGQVDEVTKFANGVLLRRGRTKLLVDSDDDDALFLALGARLGGVEERQPSLLERAPRLIGFGVAGVWDRSFVPFRPPPSARRIVTLIYVVPVIFVLVGGLAQSIIR